jgi:uncharacterized membrane protein (TIGR02234 family)
VAEGARRTFGAALLAGVSTSGLTAIAASQTWLRAHGDAAGYPVSANVSGSDAAPLALALALVALAAWGVVLVSGVTARRLALAVALVCAVGVVVVAARLDADSAAATTLATKGASSVSSLAHRPWYATTVIAAVLQVLVVAVSFRRVPTWPTMSSRYDAPTRSGGADVADVLVEGADDLTLWKALDEGHDPTAPPPRTNP